MATEAEFNLNYPPIALVKATFNYDPDSGILTWKGGGRAAEGSTAGHLSNGYLTVRFGSTCKYPSAIAVHRVAWALHHGQWPDSDIDHINGDRADNRASNLRLATRSQNLLNQPARSYNKTGFKGVYRSGSGFIARMTANRKKVYLGYFKTAEAAHDAYEAAAKACHGEFYCTRSLPTTTHNTLC